MTRIAAMANDEKLIVGADTQLTNSLTGQKFEKQKIFYGNGKIITALGSLEFYTSDGLITIDKIIEDALKLSSIKETINFIEDHLIKLYIRYNIVSYLTQAIIFWKSKQGFCFFPLEVGVTQFGQLYSLFKYAQQEDDKLIQLYAKDKLIEAGDGISGLSVTNHDFSEDCVPNYIRKAINDTSLPTVGGHCQIVTMDKNCNITSKIIH